MSKTSDNSYVYFALFFLFVPLLILSVGLGANVVDNMEFQTAPLVQDEVTQTFDGDDWNLGDFSMSMLYNSDGYIYPDQNSMGTWTSPIADVPRNRVVAVNYDADMVDGSGTITVNAWTNEPSGDPLPEPNATETYNLETGMVTQEVGFSEYNYFQTEINMTEEANDNDRFPRMNKLEIVYEIVEGRQIGMDKAEVYITFHLLMLLAIAYFISGLALKLREA